MATSRAQSMQTSSSSSGKKRAEKKARKADQPEPEAAIPMGKLLASTEKKTRDSAIKSLALFLATSGEEPIAPLEMAKLWKGIFYCFWMSDKPLVQQALAQELSDLLLSIPGSSKGAATAEAAASVAIVDGMTNRARGGLALLEGFWTAMAREWSGLDKWRLDKFYLLLRRFVNAAFRLLATEQWNQAAVARFTALTTQTGGPLCANDVQVPASLTYHMTDIYLEELEKALIWNESQSLTSTSLSEEEEDSKTKTIAPAPILALLQPMIDTASTCHSSTVLTKIQDNVLEPLWEDCLAAAATTTADAADDDHQAGSRRGAKRRKRSGKMFQPSSEEEGGDRSSSEETQVELAYPAILKHSGMPPLQLRSSLFKALFLSASREEAIPSRRRTIYGLWKVEKDRRENAGEEDEEEGGEE